MRYTFVFSAVVAVCLSGCADPGLDPAVTPLLMITDAGSDDAAIELDARLVKPDGGPPPIDWGVIRDAAPPEVDWRALPDDDAAVIDPPDMAPDDPPQVRLQVHALDIWAQPLVDYELVVLGPDDRPLGGAERGLRMAPGTYEIYLTAPDHHRTQVTLRAPDDDDAEGVGVDRDGVRNGLTVWRRGDRIDIYLGLRHRWFAASGRPARHGNRIDFLMDGEEGWDAVYAAMLAARATIHAATWWWQSDFEVTRDGRATEPAERQRNTIMAVLEASPARKRISVFSNALFDFLNVDRPLTDHGETDDDFEYMGQGNPTSGRFRWEIPPFKFGDRVADMQGLNPAALDLEDGIESEIPSRIVDLEITPFNFAPAVGSYHQKFFVMDGTHAFVGGMNAKSTDWDTSEHRVYDARRMEFGASAGRRAEVAQREREPDLGPRKDYILGIVGPMVQDVEETFAIRWRLLLDQAAENSEFSSDYAVEREHQVFADGVQAQLANTMPEPFLEYAIFESNMNAVANAETYILIEDQYWRTPQLVEAIIRRMAAEPDLQLIVVTKPVGEWTDPGCYWTHVTNERLQDRFPGRYHTYRMRAFDFIETWGFDETEGIFKEMDIHSKLMIVDDVYLSVGSCNKNGRGYVYEGETNVNVFDPEWVANARQRVVANYLGVDEDRLPADWMAAMEDQAMSNEIVLTNWDDEGFDISNDDNDQLPPEYAPEGFMYPLSFAAPSDCFIEAIGPDIAYPQNAGD
ncbi:MAG: phosphatidylserine/phosphatidylglycerophosphate/cardiolipin synthase-like enzyme [Bradymonadia bacterium]|jgi:phosphatidylserine/phosphatidylglycerophosphate/cardiolipin synthase-like enzyme